jgi:hypothetical protein
VLLHCASSGGDQSLSEVPLSYHSESEHTRGSLLLISPFSSPVALAPCSISNPCTLHPSAPSLKFPPPSSPLPCVFSVCIRYSACCYSDRLRPPVLPRSPLLMLRAQYPAPAPSLLIALPSYCRLSSHRLPYQYSSMTTLSLACGLLLQAP